MAESFFASLECELIARRFWKSQAEARTALFAWIEGWYNLRRLHSALAYLSPVDCERKHVTLKDHAPKHGLPTVAAASLQAPTAALDNPAPMQSSARESRHYRPRDRVKTNTATPHNGQHYGVPTTGVRSTCLGLYDVR